MSQSIGNGLLQYFSLIDWCIQTFISRREEDISLKEVDFSLKEKDFSLKEKDFSLKEEDFSLKEVDLSLKEFSMNKVDFSGLEMFSSASIRNILKIFSFKFYGD